MNGLKSLKGLVHRSGYQYVFRKSSSAVERAKSFYVGQKLHGYTIKEIEPVSELSLTAIRLQHDRTRAQHLHVARDDVNNTFGVSFRTTPKEDSGVPHILEHTALCGSRKYPVRDPFFKMLNRSLSTFMNAFTASDWTMYPFSTQNHQDYENLMSVYLDACFFPKLQETDFRQEGWRLEHEDINDNKSNITLKGIVFNEMKGVFSNSQQLYHQRLQNLLLPSNTYAVVSGGLPEAIPTLSWQALRQFHASYYHPSNSRFYTYGSFDMESHLEFIDREVLQKFTHSSEDTSVAMETRWTQERRETMECAPNPMSADQNKQTTVSVSYLLKELVHLHHTLALTRSSTSACIQDTNECFTWQLIGHLLVGGDTSPFAESLLDSNIGTDLAPGTGFSGDLRETSFTVGLQGIDKADTQKVLQLIEDTLDKVINEGFNPEHIDAFLHMIELSIKHQSNGFGLNLGVSILPVWNHDGSPIEALKVNDRIAVLKQKLLEDPKFLQNKVRNELKNNAHKLTLTMNPDVEFDTKRETKEKALVADLVSKLSPADREQVFVKGKELNVLQSTKEDISCLPTLTLKDIPKSTDTYELNTHTHDNVTIQTTYQPTNDLTFVNLLLSLDQLPQHLLQYIPLFCHVSTRMAAGDMSFKQFNDKIDLCTGGLNVSTLINDHTSIANSYQKAIVMSSYCLNRNTPKMLDLWTDVFHRLDTTDSNRLRTLIQASASDLAFGIDQQGHRYALTSAAATLNAASALREVTGGLSQVKIMKTISEMKDLSPVILILKEIAQSLLNKNQLKCSVITNEDNMTSSLKQVESFITNLPGTCEKTLLDQDFYATEKDFKPESLEFHQQLPFQVNFLGRVCTTVPYEHEHFASLRILGTLMTSKFLHREIREKGGAYGGGASGDSTNQFKFYSYRDPSVSSTIETFDLAVDWACQGQGYVETDIDEAKLSVFSKLDAPTPPGSRGNMNFLYGVSDQMKEQYRSRLFTVNRDDLVDVAQRYLKVDNRTSSLTLIGPENEMTNKCKGWKVAKET